MKIGIEAQRLFRAKKHGMDIVALESLRELQRLDHENDYVVFVRPDEDRACLPDAANVTIWEVPGASYPSWEQIALPRAVAASGVEMLHCTANTAPLHCPVPLLLTLHDVIYLEGDSPFQHGGTWYQRLGNMYRSVVVPSAVRQAESVLTVSQYEKTRIRLTLPMAENKLEVVYNGVGAHFHPVTDAARLAEVRARYDLPEPFLFFLGNTAPKKNLRGVVTAYARYVQRASNPLPLVIADLSPTHLSRLLHERGCADLRPHFVLPGYIANADLPAIYSQCALFLYPSLRESFGIPILEAMACGAPVITSDCTSMPEVAGEAALLVDPLEPVHLTQMIDFVLDQPALAQTLRQRGIERAAQFSWQATARRLMTLYQELGQSAILRCCAKAA